MAYKQQTALITGGCGGLGKSIAERFLLEGANVVVCDISDSLIAEFKENVSSAYPECTVVVKCDITSESALDDLFAKAEETFGGVHFVVNNAGIIDHFQPIGDMPFDEWDRVIAVNLTAPAKICQRAIKSFLKHETKGSIVNICSIASLRGMTCGAAYTASKHGLLGLTKNTGAFYASKGIRCNAILPGGMRTNIGNGLATGYHQEGMARSMLSYPTEGGMGWADTKQIAGLVLYLCSEDAACVNGAAWSADGGTAAA